MLIFFSAFDILTTSEFPQRRCKRKFLPHPCLQLQWPRGPSGWCVGRRGQLEWTRVGGVTFLGKVKPQRVSLPPSASFSFLECGCHSWRCGSHPVTVRLKATCKDSGALSPSQWPCASPPTLHILPMCRRDYVAIRGPNQILILQIRK